MTSNTESNASGLWEGDELNRTEVGRFLKKYLNNKFIEETKKGRDSTFVLNLNAGWGCGKTFLMDHWAKELSDEEYCVVNFNAWTTDFSSDPLLAFISSISDQLKAQLGSNISASKVDALVKTAKLLIKPSVPFLLSVITKKLTGMAVEEVMEQLGESGNSETESENPEEGAEAKAEDSAEGTEAKVEKIATEDILATLVSKGAEQSLKEHKRSENAIKAFTKNLKALILAIKKDDKKFNLPLYIFIDELDRCRPSYAIELLENIKHLFGVSGVYFVIATDSTALCHSIKAVYGAEFDSEKYLKRFFDQEFQVPDPDFKSFAGFLASKLGEPETPNQHFFPLKPETYPTIREVFPLYAKVFSLDLRSQEQCYAKLEALRILMSDNNAMHLGYLLPLIMIQHSSNSLFSRYCLEGLGPIRDTAFFAGMKNCRIEYTYRNEQNSFDRLDTSLFQIFDTYDTLQAEKTSSLLKRTPGDLIIDNIIATLGGNFFDKTDYPYFHYYRDQVKHIGQLK